MFNVQCPGCSAPYQVDERRVPASGLRMRCPKCATSFVVEKPATEATSSEDGNQAYPALAQGSEKARPPSPPKATMIGVAGPSLTGENSRGGLQANLRTGTAVPIRPDDSPPSQSKALPERPDLPSVPRRKPPPPIRAGSATESDLPAALSPRAGPRAPQMPPYDASKAAQSVSKNSIDSAERDETWALPELAKEPPLVAPAISSSRGFDLDSPIPLKAPPRPVSSASSSIDVDLPISRTSQDVNTSPQREVKVYDDLEIDLPSPFEAMSDYHPDNSSAGAVLDLDLPSPSTDAALPSPARVDLPSVPKSTLPALSQSKPGHVATGKKRFGDVELLPDIDPLKDSRLPAAVQQPSSLDSDLILILTHHWEPIPSP